MTEYKRIQGKSYMICRAEERDFGYELRMLLQNKIEGMLPLQLEQQEELTGFWYDISGKNDLESYRKLHKIDRVFLEKFFRTLQQLVEKAGEYLLPEDGISLHPAKIFIDYDKNDISFCYTPFEKRSFTERVKEFMEYFLQNMDHGNQDDIQKCYEVYEQVQKDNISLNEIVQELWDLQPEEMVFKEPNQEMSSVKEDGLRNKVAQKKNTYSKRDVRIPWRKKKQENVPFVFEPEEEVSENISPTVFLGSETNEILGELRYEGEGMQKNMKITEEEFLIGKEKGEVDGEISASTVSRMHAKIYREGNVFYIEDLNSTNGTYRNGVLLNYKERVPMEKNDVIRFAEETYRFV